MPAVDPRDHVFRKMLIFSGIAHVAALLVSALWIGLLKAPLRPVPITVVSLIGGAQFHRQAEPSPDVRQARAARHEPVRRTRPAPAPATVKKPAPPAPPASREAMPPADTNALGEKIRKLREERTGSERIRALAREAGREKEYRNAIGSIRERVAHRVDLTLARPAPRGEPAPAAASGGPPGGVRISPEQLRYFHDLDERVRENWVLSGLAVKDPEKLMVQIRITIERDGRVSEVRMEKTSGNGYFDDSVLRAIKKASPLPVPPEALRGGENYYEVGFRFFGTGGGR